MLRVVRVAAIRPSLLSLRSTAPVPRLYRNLSCSPITSIQLPRTLPSFTIPRLQLTRTYCSKEAPKTAAPPPPQPELSKKDKLKKAFKDYGATVVIFHIGISLVSLGGFYLLVSSGLDVVALVEKLGFSSEAVSKVAVANASTFIVAYAIHKVFAPVRISITLFSTPFIVRFLRSRGILKPPKKF